MKKVVQINSVKNGSTGRIMNSLARKGREKGLIAYTSCAGNLYQRRLTTENPKFHIYIGGIFENKFHKTLGTIYGCGGCFSHIGTFIFLLRLNRIKPDLIHLHNLHSNYINLKMLFSYIKKKKIPVIWTLHDCWAFTGHCPHFQIAHCEKWKRQCGDCPQFRLYPEAKRDDSKFMYKKKKELFTGVDNLILVTPSQWLADLTCYSFLKDYPVRVIHNGIDLKTFQFRLSNFRKEYHLEDKIIVLGISFSWSYRKGIDIFIKLAEKLHDVYQIVLVGGAEEYKKDLPDNIIDISFTNSAEELAKLYSMADVFVNPTREDTFPTTHLESLACGTPVITFRTGGAVESVDETCGRIIEQNDIEGLVAAIDELVEANIPRDACRKKAESFSLEKQYQEYIKLYCKITKDYK